MDRYGVDAAPVNEGGIKKTLPSQYEQVFWRPQGGNEDWRLIIMIRHSLQLESQDN